MNKEFFIKNRKALEDKLQDNSVLVLFAGRAPYKTADEVYPFTPNRNFYYLTGIDEEKIILFVSKINGKVTERLFIQRPDPIMAKWVGATISEDEAKEVSGVAIIDYMENFQGVVGSIINRNHIDTVYLDLERQELTIPTTESQDFAKILKDRYAYMNIKNVFNEIANLRMIKSTEEIDLMKKAIDITNEGILNMMKNIEVGMPEYEVEAYFEFILKKNGVKDKAFQTIAASGVNATILHYVNNDFPVKDGDLILFDLGAQHKYYNADISRTFPVNGKFTDRQKAVYNVVLKAQKAVEEAVKPGLPFRELNEIAKKVLGEGCIELGLIKDVSEVSKYYYHGVSHFLGLDTHDVGSYDVVLQPGMVITNEPGLYIEEEAIGIRIEDDLLITENACENLSSHIIKTVEEIESFMNK